VVDHCLDGIGGINWARTGIMHDLAYQTLKVYLMSA
jgi:hypothetical protein